MKDEEKKKRKKQQELTSLVTKGAPKCQKCLLSSPLYTTLPNRAMVPGLYGPLPGLSSAKFDTIYFHHCLRWIYKDNYNTWEWKGINKIHQSHKQFNTFSHNSNLSIFFVLFLLFLFPHVPPLHTSIFTSPLLRTSHQSVPDKCKAVSSYLFHKNISPALEVVRHHLHCLIFLLLFPHQTSPCGLRLQGF